MLKRRSVEKVEGSDFFRFPSIPHLAWLGEGGGAREDKVLSLAEVRDLLSRGAVVEEKLDGANLGISLSGSGDIQVQNRGQYIDLPCSGQFSRLTSWLMQHEGLLRDMLGPNLIMFGEWCAARHSLSYDALPDWFLMFDIYDRDEGMFWDTSRRNAFAEMAGLFVVRRICCGYKTLDELTRLVMSESSQYRDGGPLEGIVVRNEALGWSGRRAKLVRPDFVQSIETHWRSRPIEWNRIDWRWREARFS